MARLGEGVLGADGSIDRARVANLVFADRSKLDFLEQLLHPRVAQEYLTWRDQLGELPNPPAVSVTEVPLLYETGGDKRFDKVVVITAPAKLREQPPAGSAAGECPMLLVAEQLPDSSMSSRWGSMSSSFS